MPIATSTTAVIAYKYHDYTTTMVCATENNCSSVIMVLYLYHIYDKITVVKRFFFGGENHRGMCNRGKYIYGW